MSTKNSIETNKSIVREFIEVIWNKNRLVEIENYLSEDYLDHSLLPTLPPNKEGTLLWIKATGKSFEHETIINDMVCEDDKVMLKISMKLKHIGVWRDIAPTHLELYINGFRYYKMQNGKIKEHWALINGNAIENQLKNTHNSCKIVE